MFTVPPTIRPDPPDGNYVVKKGRKIELKCVASGNPDPTITWTRQVRHDSQIKVLCRFMTQWISKIQYTNCCCNIIYQVADRLGWIISVTYLFKARTPHYYSCSLLYYSKYIAIIQHVCFQNLYSSSSILDFFMLLSPFPCV